jgi:hypothetical protein
MPVSDTVVSLLPEFLCSSEAVRAGTARERAEDALTIYDGRWEV